MSQLLTPTFPDYELIDSGDFEKLERFGRYVTRRPEPQAIERPSSTRLEARFLYCREPAHCILSAYCILHIECSTFHSIIFQDLE